MSISPNSSSFSINFERIADSQTYEMTIKGPATGEVWASASDKPVGIKDLLSFLVWLLERRPPETVGRAIVEAIIDLTEERAG